MRPRIGLSFFAGQEIMLQSFFLICKNGEVLIEKHWREVTPRSVCDFFWDEVNKYETKEEMPPVVHTLSLIHI